MYGNLYNNVWKSVQKDWRNNDKNIIVNFGIAYIQNKTIQKRFIYQLELPENRDRPDWNLPEQICQSFGALQKAS